MAEQGSDNEKKQEPPKIKLGDFSGEDVKFDQPDSPPLSREQQKKSETSRIDLSEAMEAEESDLQEPGEDLQESMKKSTIRIDMPIEEEAVTPAAATTPDEEAKKSTIKIDAAEQTENADDGLQMSEADQAALEESAKRSTIKIDMPEEEEIPPPATAATPDEESKKSTIRIDSEEPQAPFQEPSPEDIEASAKRSTIRIDAPQEEEYPAEQEKVPDVSDEAKKSTIKIDTEPTAAQPKAPPSGISSTEMRDESAIEGAKKSTIRIDVPEERLKDVEQEDVTEGKKKKTVRVQVDEEARKGDTQPVDTEKATQQLAEGQKKSTSRIDIGDVLSKDEEADIFKRRTAVLDASKFPPAAPTAAGPRTIRIKRPSQTPPTAIMSEPPTSTQISKPKGATQRVKPKTQAAPPEAEATPAPKMDKTPTAMAVPTVEDAKKSETARIELPPEASGSRPPTRRKTVRIKRPDGTSASRELTIARPSKAPAMEAEEKTQVPVEKTGPVFSILALVATLVLLVLLYVLAAQTIGTGLPFPGRVM